MEKKLHITKIIALLLTCFSAGAQTSYLRLGGDHCTNFRQPFTSVSIGYEKYFSNKFSIEYSASFGLLSEGFYFRTGAGQTLGIMCLALAANGDRYRRENNPLAWFGTLCLIIPERLNYTIQESEKIQLRVYTSPLTTDFLISNNLNSYKKFELASEFGIKIRTQPSNSIDLVPNAGFKAFYASGNVAFVAGLTLGIAL